MAEPLPPLKVARSLQDATKDDAFYVDRHGRVGSPARLRLVRAGGYALAGVAVVLGPWAYYRLLGPLGAVIGGGLSLWLVWAVICGQRLRRAGRLFMAGRLDEAGDLYASLHEGTIVSSRVRKAATHMLAGCRAVQGRHEESRALYESVVRGYGRSKNAFAVMARQGEAMALINLGQLEEARRRFEALGAAPAGDMVRMRHFTLELYLAMAEGRHALSVDELHERARFALAITTAAPLLGLLAWAHALSGDHDMSQHLLKECRDRHPGQRLSGPLPLLQTWLDQA